MTPIVQVAHLSKAFTEVHAVNDLSFTVPRGEVYGFLGQNGAGKSTTIRMMLTLIRPSSGSIRLFGMDLQQQRKAVLRKIGAIIEKPDLYKYLTAYQNLSIMAKLSGVRASRAQLMKELDRVGLAERAHSLVKTFSQGMKQRLGIACALIHDPELIILDEPTNGLDPQGIADIRNLILHLSREEGKTVFVSSHLLSEIEIIADSMLIIDRGVKKVEGRVADLLNPADTIVQLEVEDREEARRLLRESAFNRSVQESESLVLKMHRNEIPALTKYLVERNVALLSVQPKHSLEDYFLSLTKGTQHVAAYRN